MHESDRESLKDSESELSDIFPALKTYKAEHTEDNLGKLCNEISEFCHSVYASTRSDRERAIYRRMIGKL